MATVLRRGRIKPPDRHKHKAPREKPPPWPPDGDRMSQVTVLTRSPHELPSLGETIQLLAKLESIIASAKTISSQQKCASLSLLDATTARRLTELPMRVWEEARSRPGPEMAFILTSFTKSYELILYDILNQANISIDCDAGCFAAYVDSRLDNLMIDVQHAIDHWTHKSVTLPPQTNDHLPSTSFFQGAHNFVVNGGNFGQAMDEGLRDQCEAGHIFSTVAFTEGFD